MKIHLLIVILVCFVSKLSIAQNYWNTIATPDSVILKTLAVSHEGNIIIGTNQGVYESDDDGQSWRNIGNSDFYVKTIALIVDGGMLAGGGAYLYRYYPNDSSWQLVNSYHPCLNLFVNSSGILFSGDWGGICKSEDYGASWDSVYVTYSTRAFYEFIELGDKIFCSSTSYSNTSQSGIYSSYDLGESWILDGLQGYGVKPIRKFEDDNILAGSSGLNGGIEMSIDTGSTWTNIFSSGDVYSLAVNSHGIIIAGLSSSLGSPWGIRFSDNGGDTWDNLTGNISYTSYISDIEISHNNFIYVFGSYDSDTLYRSMNPIVDIEENLSSFESIGINVFPNPATNYLNVHLKCDRGMFLDMKIIDIYGRQFYHQSAISRFEKFETQISLDDLIPGMYFICVSYNDEYQNIPFIVLQN